MKHRVLFDQGHHTPAAVGNIVMENQYPSLFGIYYDDLTKLSIRFDFIHRRTFFFSCFFRQTLHRLFFCSFDADISTSQSLCKMIRL